MAPAPETSILLVRLKSLGDIILSTVIVTAIRKEWPQARIDYLVDPPFAGVAAAFPGVRRELIRPRSWAGRLRLLAGIQGSYDVAVDLHGSAAAAILARFAARGPVLGWAGKRLSRLYTVRVEDRESTRHTVEVNLDMVRALGLPEPGTPRFEEPRNAEREAHWAAAIQRPGVLLHPGARFPCKAWPDALWRRLADRLSERGLVPHLLVGPGERPGPELEGLPVVTGVPAGELVYLARAFELFIGTDSGPMHAAAAAGCRTVGIFGPSGPERWRPWGSRCRFVSVECGCGMGWQGTCRTPDRHCLRSLDPERVMKAVEMLCPGPGAASAFGAGGEGVEG